VRLQYNVSPSLAIHEQAAGHEVVHGGFMKSLEENAMMAALIVRLQVQDQQNTQNFPLLTPSRHQNTIMANLARVGLLFMPSCTNGCVSFLLH